MRDRLGQIALSVQRPREVEANSCRRWVERHRMATMSDRLVEAAERLIDASDVVVEVGIAAVQHDGALDQL